jgi:hypothetical protein
MARLLARLLARTALAWEGRPLAGAVAPLPRVLLHRLVDEVVDAALELARHLLERLPEDVAALERARAFLIRIRAHFSLLTEILAVSFALGEVTCPA